jgi:mannitol operon repressor
MADDEKKFAFAVGHTRRLEETHPHLKGFVEFLGEFNKETARGAALAAAAFLDDLLAGIINAFLVANDSRQKLTEGFNAPVGTLSARIAACHAMGLISEVEARECELVRKVRNEFAHKVKMSFDDERVRGLCSSMRMSAKPYDDVEVDTRGQFTTAAVALILNLTNRAHYVGEKALKYQEWKI